MINLINASFIFVIYIKCISDYLLYSIIVCFEGYDMESFGSRDNIKIQSYKDTSILTYKRQSRSRSKEFKNNLTGSLIKAGIGLGIGITALILLKADFVFYPILVLLAIMFGFGYPILKETSRNQIKILVDEESLFIPKQIIRLPIHEISEIQSHNELLENGLINVMVVLTLRNGKKEQLYLNEVTEEDADRIIKFLKETIEKKKQPLPPYDKDD